MKNVLQTTKGLVLLSGLIFCVSSVGAQGEALSYFDASTLNSMLEHRDCAGVRFYNVINPSNNERSTMAIGIREDESEIANLTNRYHVFSSATTEGVDYKKLTRNKAAEACQAVKSNGASSFSASFTKEDMSTMLKAAPTGGVIVKQKSTESTPMFEAQPATLIEGQVAPLARSQAMMSGEPCPTFCGNPRNFIHM